MFSILHIHPMVVHFPIALILLAFLVEFINLTRKDKSEFFNEASYYLMLLGSIAGIVTILTGFLFTQEMIGEAGILREQHEDMAVLSTICITIATVIRIVLRVRGKESSNMRWIYLVFFFISVLGIMYTGLLGGNLVYNYLIGI
ncbi:MAG: DUF2231 domain-containing protein [Chloroherpetonaceae bacterium]